jgi:hypothetical protein
LWQRETVLSLWHDDTHIFNHNFIIFFPFLLVSYFFFLPFLKKTGPLQLYWTKNNLYSFCFCVAKLKKPLVLSNVETKRACTLMESKASQSQTALKKPRSSSEPRPSCPPFKVPSFLYGRKYYAPCLTILWTHLKLPN